MNDEPKYKHPMSQGIHNTIEGSNYLRAGEMRKIIEELERLAEYDSARTSSVEPK